MVYNSTLIILISLFQCHYISVHKQNKQHCVFVQIVMNLAVGTVGVCLPVHAIESATTQWLDEVCPACTVYFALNGLNLQTSVTWYVFVFILRLLIELYWMLVEIKCFLFCTVSRLPALHGRVKAIFESFFSFFLILKLAHNMLLSASKYF